MIDWINSHGIALLVGYYMLISILGTMPELPPDASYMHKWAFAAAHALCGNMQRMVASLKNGNGVKPEPPKENTNG